MKSIALILLSILAKADPGFSCRNNETGVEEILDLKGYIECGSECTCSVFEIICLVKDEIYLRDTPPEKVINSGFTLQLRSVEFLTKYCEAPNCLCNTFANFSHFSYWILQKNYRVGEPVYIELPSYQALSQALPGTYAANLVKEFNVPTHDYHNFVHPFKELTTQTDLLRRVLDPFDWDEFIEGCIDSVISNTPDTETEEDKEIIESFTRRL